MIKLENVSKKFKKQEIVDNITISFPNTGCIAIQGPNGSGKSVILNIICGFIKPDTGKVYINDKELTKNNSYIYDAGIIINSPEFIPYKTVRENLYDIASILDYNNTSNKIEELLEYFDLKKDENKKVNVCSLGMKQKMRLIQAFMEPHPIYILDEPTSSLDKKMVKKVIELVNDLKKTTLVIITSHYESDINSLADECYELVNGKLEYNEE